MYNIKLDLKPDEIVMTRDVTWNFVPHKGMKIKLEQLPIKVIVQSVTFLPHTNKFVVVLTYSKEFTKKQSIDLAYNGWKTLHDLKPHLV